MSSKVNDSYKDVNGKGLTERYQESLGDDYDDNLRDLIDVFLDRTIVPQNMLSRMIPYMESMLGDPVIVSDQVSFRRKIIRFAQHIYNIKSTRLSYEVLFRMLGFDTAVVFEYTNTSGFDSDLTFDDVDRTFDGDSACTYYSVELTGVISITPEIILAIDRIIKFLEPINAHLRIVTYNGGEITIFEYFDDYFGDEFA